MGITFPLSESKAWRIVLSQNNDRLKAEVFAHKQRKKWNKILFDKVNTYKKISSLPWKSSSQAGRKVHQYLN